MVSSSNIFKRNAALAINAGEQQDQDISIDFPQTKGDVAFFNLTANGERK